MQHADHLPAHEWLGPWLKGFPERLPTMRRVDIGRHGLSLRDADLPLPLAVIRQDALHHNLGWMQRFAEQQGVALAPHGKTTMSPQLFQKQLAAGAWGLSFATVYQLRQGVAAGARRVLLANQLCSLSDLASLLQIRREHAGSTPLTLAFFVDSMAQLDLIEAHWARLGAEQSGEARLDVLIEIGSSRCGVRNPEDALALARRLWGHTALRLRGLAFYEGLEARGMHEGDRALMLGWEHRLNTVLEALESEGLVEEDARPLWLSGGGSALFDLVAPLLRGSLPPKAERPERLGLLRSGCYVCHDHGLYERMRHVMDERLSRTALGGADLRPALEVWCEVISCPEPGLALLNAGRRDVSFDQGWPLPVWHAVLADRFARQAAPQGWQISGLNDQHAYLRWDPAQAATPSVGDRVALGPSHPCTTFDKWSWMAMVDEQDRVVDAITTQFG
ncbi:MAG: alanine racemase [Roseateles sp.]